MKVERDRPKDTEQNFVTKDIEGDCNLTFPVLDLGENYQVVKKHVFI